MKLRIARRVTRPHADGPLVAFMKKHGASMRIVHVRSFTGYGEIEGVARVSAKHEGAWKNQSVAKLLSR